MKYAILILGQALLVSSAGAQNVVITAVAGQPLQYQKGGAINGCGVRVVGMPEAARGVAEALTFDASINLYAPGVGLLKAVGGTVKVTDVQAYGRAPERGLPPEQKWRPKSFWFKAQGVSATTPRTGSVSPGVDPPESMLYVTDDIDTVIAVLMSVKKVQQIQFAIAEPAKNVERIYQASVRLGEQETNSLAGCLRELVDNITKK